MLEPLFEFSGACGGCGETPYIRLVSQLFGDRMIVANATGCSSIYGANLPTTPWTVNAAGRGPAWNNSLFEDNAEFGLGMRLALDAQTDHARQLVERLAPELGPDLGRGSSRPPGHRSRTSPHSAIASTGCVTRWSRSTAAAASDARHLLALAGDLVRKGVWIIGGDGWAYDIGFGGLDQVLSSGRNVNILVLDTEVYSNTGGQASKATPRGAVAKFAAAGKGTAKKDLGAIARSYGNVYVAQVSMGANDQQTPKALLEADAWPGPSLVIAYSTCIAHGIDMTKSMTHQKDAVKSGYWPLYRFHPVRDRGRQAVQARLGDPVDPDRRLRRDRDPLRGPRADASGAGGRARDARPGRCRRALALLRAARRHRADGPARRSTRPEIVPEVESDAGYRYDRSRGRMTVDLRTRYLGLDLRSPIVASAAPHNGDPATARLVSRRPGVGAIVLPSLFEEEILAEEIEAQPLARAGHRALRRGARLLPGDRDGSSDGADRYLDVARAGQGPRARAGHREPQRQQRRRLGSATPAASRPRAPTPSSSTCTTSPRIPAGRPPRWRRPTSTSSRRSAAR